jgi:N-hydroxyarylamine O-acetyltransferase
MYVFDLQPQTDIDYVVGNWYVSTLEDSPFLGQLVAARTGPGLRRTLSNGSYAIHRLGAASERRQLTQVDAVIDVLQSDFGIRVPQHPDLRDIVARLVAAP